MTALLAWLWQGLVLAAIVGLLLRAAPRLNAAARHATWWAALAGVVALAGLHAGGPAAAPGLSPELGAAAAPSVEPLLTLPEAPAWVPAAMLGAWLALAIHRFSGIVRGLLHVRRLRAHAVPVDPARALRLRGWSRTRGSGRRSQLCLTAEPVSACALGFRRPAILVSQRLMDTLDDDALDQVVMHEQAHLDRFDDWLRLGQSIVVAMAAIHPAAHFIDRRIDLEREAACDDRVVSVTGAAGEYAACLAEAATVKAAGCPAGVPAVFGGGRSSSRSLRARILRLLDPRADRGRRFARPAVVTAATWVTAVLIAAPQLPLLVAFAGAPSPSPVTGRDFTAAEVSPAADGVLPDGAVAPRAASPSGGRPQGRQADARTRQAAWARPLPSKDLAARPLQAAAALLPEAGPGATALHDMPTDTLGMVGLAVADAPPRQPVTPGAHAPAPGAESSFGGDVASMGRNSAATARKAGLSLAGTVTRAGKALGRLF